MPQHMTPRDLFYSSMLLRNPRKAVYFRGNRVIGIRHYDENTFIIILADGREKFLSISVDSADDCFAVVELEWTEFA